MGSKAKTPATPDYTQLAMTQAGNQQQLINQQTAANRPTQANPFGQVQWTQDASGNWTQTTSLNPALQAAAQQLMQAQAGQAGQIAGQGAFDPSQAGQVQALNPYQMTTGPYDQAGADRYADAYTKQLLARVTPQQEVDRNAMATRLRLQGLQPGSEAYDRAFKNLLTSQGDVNTQAALQGMLYGNQEARADLGTKLSFDAAAAANAAQNNQLANAAQQQKYNQMYQNYMAPYQAAGATQQLQAGLMPQFGAFAPAGVGQAADIVGAAQQSYAQNMQNANQKNADKSSKGSTIGSIAGGVGGFMLGGPAGAYAGSQVGGAAGGAIFSDATLKHDIGVMDDEQAFHKMLEVIPAHWKWNDTGSEDSGVIAQSLAEILPDMVQLAAVGKLTVNYTGLFALLQGAFRHLAKELNNVR